MLLHLEQQKSSQQNEVGIHTRAHARTLNKYAYMHELYTEYVDDTGASKHDAASAHTHQHCAFNPLRKIEFRGLETKHRNATDCQSCTTRRLLHVFATAGIR